jgi:serine/threonine protein phosphatase PrpC
VIILPNSEGQLHLLTTNMGNSRIYIFDSETNNLVQLTREYSLVEIVHETKPLTQKQNFTHAYKNLVTNTVGINIDQSKIDFVYYPVKPGMVIIVATDGFHQSFYPECLPSVIAKTFD